MFPKNQVKQLVNSLLTISKQNPLPLHAEHIHLLVAQLLHYHQHQTLHKLPYFIEECTPAIQPGITPFYTALCHWLNNPEEGTQLLSQAYKSVSINDLLLILGQRRTPASITTEQALPPLRKHLSTAFSTYHKQHTLSVGARAWCKHVNRSEQEFWGVVKGNDEEKNKAAEELLNHLLDNTTWWNVFEHYKHDLVYEVRLPSGHGARWSVGDMRFIGFLEPFIEQA
ncbi:hypothetical protein [Microscilla marina]|uniref:ProFAR isomerase associated, putative n=1 Tax=Microscilla marina ATCC 23134 TaxID=313606 RepID=A1ZWU4_MICM2|nr:hypothetical protein [Microscilla marina]EAY25121.1 ProFAR isomerase associated, putative [Microscilla marina ATCC 23134]